MGDLLGNLLLSILAIFLPPVAAIIKVNIASLRSSSANLSGRMYDALLDQHLVDHSRLVTGNNSCSLADLGGSFHGLT